MVEMQHIARRLWLSVFLALLLGLFPACHSGSPTRTDTATLATPAASTSSSVTARLPEPSTMVTVSTEITLVVWTSVDFAPNLEALSQELEGFETTSFGVHLNVQQKGAEGIGGLVNLLATAAPVAPTVLPDAAIVNASQARALAERGLIRPWDELLPSAIEEDMFPLAQQLGRYEGHRVGVPLALDVQHVIYNTSKVSSPPGLWRDVVTGESFYLFPAAGEGEALDTFLIQYVEAGGEFQDETGAVLLQEEPLVAALARYQGAQMAGIVPAEAIRLTTLSAGWSLYLSGQVDILQVWASDYLTRQPSLLHTAFSTVPGTGEAMVTAGRGWLAVLVTGEASRQEQVARLVGWWLSPERAAALCRAMGWLPPSRMVFTEWQHSGRYDPFVQRQLEVAVPEPGLPASWAEALSSAIGQVLSGNLTSQQAAAQVMSVVTSG